MSFTDELRRDLAVVEMAFGSESAALTRFKAELAFAIELVQTKEGKQSEWEGTIQKAVAAVKDDLAAGNFAREAVAKAEEIMAPLGKAAKEYTIHCVGHAHIDMNWMWDWPETVATTNDTFTTVGRLMEEFPNFHFSQSQASVYQILKDYLPELFARVKQRVTEGRWEITANQWVEGSKNLASGEILCRHLLYTKRFIHQEFGLPYDAIKIDWEPDTFGHAHTVPTIVNKAGVRWYYLHRGSDGPELFWWQGKDGSRVLVFDDRARGYNGRIGPEIVGGLLDFEQATGLKDYLFVYGVGNHGGGPTRHDLLMAGELDSWPIFPKIKLSTAEAFFSLAERKSKRLPVIDSELNFVFEGCYTSQSNIKLANRKSENALVEAEIAALLARGLAGMPYPDQALYVGWRNAMFSQFHDILPGSGGHATYQCAQGMFQEIMAQTSMVKTRALRQVAGLVNTAASCPHKECEAFEGLPAPASRLAGLQVGPGIGGGPGDVPAAGAISRRGGDSPCCDPFVVFNALPWKRSELINARLWVRDWPNDRIAVTDDAGQVFPAQVLDRNDANYWGYRYIDIVLPGKDIESCGYRSYVVTEGVAPAASASCSSDGQSASPFLWAGQGTIENEFFRVQVEQSSGAIVHLVDKRTGLDLAPPGSRIGLLEYLLEAPHPMTAWVLGQVVESRPLCEGATIDLTHRGPYLAAVRARHRLNNSTFTTTISLSAGVPRVDFTLEVEWLERGAPEIGVPALRVAFPLAVKNTAATFECANGHVERPADPMKIRTLTTNLQGSYFFGPSGVALNPGEVPAQKWADLSGEHLAGGQRVGATLVNDCKYGHMVAGNTIYLTLLRSSYDPDPLPELGNHTIRFALYPHDGDWSVSDSTRAGYAFNLPLNVVSTTLQTGALPGSKGFAELLTPNVMLSGMKKAEESDALIVRLYEMEGRPTTAQLRLDPALAGPSAAAVETDLLEQPLAKSTAKMNNGVLSVDLPAFGLVTVKIG